MNGTYAPGRWRRAGATTRSATSHAPGARSAGLRTEYVLNQPLAPPLPVLLGRRSPSPLSGLGIVARAGWPGKELQAASSEVVVTAPVKHATRRCTRPDVSAVITRLTLPIAAGSMPGMRTGVRVAVDMTNPFER